MDSVPVGKHRQAILDYTIGLRKDGYSDEQILKMVKDQISGGHWLDGYDPSDPFTDEDLRGMILGIKSQSGFPRNASTRESIKGEGGPDFMGIGDLLNESDEEVRELVEGLLRCGSTARIVAKPKVGKTTTLTNLALSVARGEPFLGRKTLRGIVLYVALEGSRNEWRAEFRRMGATDADSEHLKIHVGKAPEDAIDWIIEQSEKYKPALIIIDTFQRFTRVKDINDYASITNATEALIELAREHDAVLALAHHSKKNNEGDDGDEVLGSTALFGAVDTLISLKKLKGSERRTITTTARYGESVPETELILDSATKLLSIGGASAGAGAGGMETRLLATLSGLGGWDGWVERDILFGAVSGRTEAKRVAFERLIADC